MPSPHASAFQAELGRARLNVLAVGGCTVVVAHVGTPGIDRSDGPGSQ